MTSAIVLDSPLDTRFDVLATLRRTAGSAVLRVRDRENGEILILETQTSRVSNEKLAWARAALGLRHRNLATVHQVDRSQNGVYWLRDDLGDVTFETVFEDSRALQPALAANFARQALDALEVLHEAGLCVRNLSPADLHLVRGENAAPRMVLADLGLGHGLASEHVPSATAVFVGRLRFASPEQFEDESKVGPASDLYALGLIVYQCLTGQFPIPGDSPSSLIAGHLFKPPTPFSASDPEGTIPESLRSWTLGLLSKAASERGDTKTQRRSLDQAAGGLGVADPSAVESFFATSADPVRLDLGLEPAEQALMNGDLEEARRLLEAARGKGGEGPAIDEMARRLAAVESFTHAAAVHRLVSTAQARLEAGAPAAAVGNLEEARRLVPDDPEVGHLLEHARKAMRRSAPSADGPTAMLHHVRDEVHAEAASRAEEEQRKREDETERIERWLIEARTKAQAEDFSAARESLQKILAVADDHPEALALLASVDACLRIQREQAQEQGEVERTVSDIHSLLEHGEADQAQESLEAAEARFGDQDVLQTVRFDITKARLDAAVTRTAQLSPADLQMALAAETAEAAPAAPSGIPAHTVSLSPELLQQVSQQPAPTSDSAATRPLPPPPPPPSTDELPSTVTLPGEAIEQAKQRALDATPPTTDVRAAAGAGSVTLPMATIEAAKRRAMEFQAESATASIPQSVTAPQTVTAQAPSLPTPPVSTASVSTPPASTPPIPAPPTSVPVASVPPKQREGHPESIGGVTSVQDDHGSVTLPMKTVVEAKQKAQAEGYAPQTPQIPTPPASQPPPSPLSGSSGAPAPAATSASSSAGPAALDILDLGFGSEEEESPSSGTQTVTRNKVRAAPPDSGPSKPLVAIGMLAILAAVFAASYFLSGRLDVPLEDDTFQPPAEDVASLALPPGLLSVDATPWAEISSLVDANGEEVTLIGARFTPKLIELPPGTYTVTLLHPPSGDSKTATLSVDSEGQQQLRVSFELTVQQFFKDAGW